MDGDRIRVVVDADADPLVREYRRAGVETRALGRTIGSQSRGAAAFNAALEKQRRSLAGLATFARRAGLAAGGALALGLAHAVRTGMDFESQMARVQAVTKATGAEMDMLRALAMRLGADTKFSAGESAEAMYQLASAGFAVAEMEGALEGTLSLAAASGIELADAAEISSNALRGFGLESSEATHVADVLAEAVNKSSVEMSHLQLTMKYIGPIAKATGQSFESMVAAVGLMGDAGIKGEQAGTTLRAGLLRLVKPIGQTKDGLKELGLSAKDVQGPDGLLPLPELVAKLEEGMEGMSRAQKNAALTQIFGQEAMSGMFELVDAGPAKLAKLTKEYRGADGAAKEAAETMNDTVSGAFEQLTGSIETVEIALYEQFKAPLKEALMDATDMVNVQGKQLQRAIEDTLASPEFDHADLGGKLELLAGAVGEQWRESGVQDEITDGLVDAFNYALPRVAEAAGHGALIAAESFARGFVQADSLGRLVIGAWLFSKLGGFAAMRAAGVLAGGQVAAGMAAGVAGGAAAGGAGAAAGGAAAGGFLSQLKRIKWGRIGAIGIGLAIGENILNGIDRRMREGSEDVLEALDAIEDKKGIVRELQEQILGPFIPDAFGDERGIEDEGTAAKNLRTQYEEMLDTRVRLSGETERSLRAQLANLDANKKMKAELRRMLDLQRESRQLGVGADLGMDPQELRKITVSLDTLRSGLLTSIGDINKVFGRTRNTIATELGAGTEQGRKAMAQSMKAAVVAIRKGMEDGEIETKVGTKRIEQLLRNAKLVTGRDPFGIAAGFRDSWKEAGRINADQRKQTLNDLAKMPPKARQQAFDAMVEYGRGLVRGKKIPERDLKTFISKAIARFESINPPAKASSERFMGIIGGSYGQAANAVWHALASIQENTTGALKSMGASKIPDFQLKALRKQLGPPGASPNVGSLPQLERQEGGVIPGSLDGDRYETGGRPGGYVMNREATRAFGLGRQQGGMVPLALEAGERHFTPEEVQRIGLPKLEAMNAAVPRFQQGLQQGGFVDPPGPGTGVVARAIAPVVGAWSQRYDAAINYGYDPGGGHVSPGHNVTGTATDTGPAAGWLPKPTGLFEQGLRAIAGKVDQILYGTAGIGESYPNHGRGNHAHIEWGMHPEVQAAMLDALPRILLSGPDGPLKAIGQGAIDKVRKAATAHLQKQLGVSGGADIGSVGAAGTLSKAQITGLWRSVNPGLGDANLMAAVALAESSGDPDIVGHDPGGTKGLGLWQITTGYNDELISRLGGRGAMLTPEPNAKAAGEILKSSGLGAWVVYNTGAYRQFLQKGGSPGKKGDKRSPASGGTQAPSPFDSAAFGTDPEKIIEANFGPLPTTVKACTQELGARRKQLDELRKALRRAKVGERRAEAEESREKQRRDREEDRRRDKAKKPAELGPLPPIKRPSKAMRERMRNIEKATKRVKERIQKLIEQRSKLLKRSRSRASNKIASRGDLPGWSRQILDARDRYERKQEFADQLIDLEPEEITQAYVDQEGAAYGDVLGKEGGWRNLLIGGIETADRKAEQMEGQIDRIKALRRKHPRAWRKQKWRIPALREGIQRAREKRGEFAGELDEVQGVGGSREPISPLPSIPVPGKFGGLIWDTQVAIKDLGLKLQGQDEEEDDGTADELRELRHERTLQELAGERLKNAQLGTLKDFLGEFGPQFPFLGAFMQGTGGRRIGRDGLALVHRDEMVTPDPKGPAGSQLSGGAAAQAGPVTVQLVLSDKSGELVRLIDARVDGRVAKIDQTIGQRGRQLSVAPGR